MALRGATADENRSAKKGGRDKGTKNSLTPKSRPPFEETPA
jgi:hypothetical protein